MSDELNNNPNEIITTKECTVCHEVKPLSDYRKQSKAKLGVKPHCRTCDDVIQNQYYTKNKKRIIKGVLSARKKKEKLAREIARLEKETRKQLETAPIITETILT